MGKRKNVFKENQEVGEVQLVTNTNALQSQKTFTPAETQAAQDARKQALVMTLTRLRAQYGHTQMSVIREHGVATYKYFIKQIEMINADNDITDPELRRLFEDFKNASAEDAGRAIRAASKTAERLLAEEIARSLYYDDDDFKTEEEKKGFLKRLFGG